MAQISNDVVSVTLKLINDARPGLVSFENEATKVANNVNNVFSALGITLGGITAGAGKG